MKTAISLPDELFEAERTGRLARRHLQLVLAGIDVLLGRAEV